MDVRAPTPTLEGHATGASRATTGSSSEERGGGGGGGGAPVEAGAVSRDDIAASLDDRGVGAGERNGEPSAAHNTETKLDGIAVDLRDRVLWHDANDTGVIGQHAAIVPAGGLESVRVEDVRILLAYPGDPEERTFARHCGSLRRPWTWRKSPKGGNEDGGGPTAPPRLRVLNWKGFPYGETDFAPRAVNHFVRTLLCGSLVSTPCGVRHTCVFDCIGERMQMGRCSTVVLEFLSGRPVHADMTATSSYAAGMCLRQDSKLPVESLRSIADATAALLCAVNGPGQGRGDNAARYAKQKHVPPVFDVPAAWGQGTKLGRKHNRRFECTLAALNSGDAAFVVCYGANFFLSRSRYELQPPSEDGTDGAAASPTLPSRFAQAFTRPPRPPERKTEKGRRQDEATVLLSQSVAHGALYAGELFAVSKWLGLSTPQIFVEGYCDQGFSEFMQECGRVRDHAHRILFTGPVSEKCGHVQAPLSYMSDQEFTVYKYFLGQEAAKESDLRDDRDSNLHSWFVHVFPFVVGTKAQEMQKIFTSLLQGEYGRYSLGSLQQTRVDGEGMDSYCVPLSAVDSSDDSHRWRDVAMALRISLGVDNLAMMLETQGEPAQSPANDKPSSAPPLRGRPAKKFDANAVSPVLTAVVRTLMDGMINVGHAEISSLAQPQSLREEADGRIADFVLSRLVRSLATFALQWVEGGNIPQNSSVLYAEYHAPVKARMGRTISANTLASWKSLLFPSTPPPPCQDTPDGDGSVPASHPLQQSTTAEHPSLSAREALAETEGMDSKECETPGDAAGETPAPDQTTVGVVCPPETGDDVMEVESPGETCATTAPADHIRKPTTGQSPSPPTEHNLTTLISPPPELPSPRVHQGRVTRSRSKATVCDVLVPDNDDGKVSSQVLEESEAMLPSVSALAQKGHGASDGPGNTKDLPEATRAASSSSDRTRNMPEEALGNAQMRHEFVSSVIGRRAGAVREASLRKFKAAADAAKRKKALRQQVEVQQRGKSVPGLKSPGTVAVGGNAEKPVVTENFSRTPAPSPRISPPADPQPATRQSPNPPRVERQSLQSLPPVTFPSLPRDPWDHEQCMRHRMTLVEGTDGGEIQCLYHVACFQSLVFALLHTCWYTLGAAFEGHARGGRRVDSATAEERAMLGAFFASTEDYVNMVGSTVWSEVESKVWMALQPYISRSRHAPVVDVYDYVGVGPPPRGNMQEIEEGGLHFEVESDKERVGMDRPGSAERLQMQSCEECFSHRRHYDDLVAEACGGKTQVHHTTDVRIATVVMLRPRWESGYAQPRGRVVLSPDDVPPWIRPRTLVRLAAPGNTSSADVAYVLSRDIVSGQGAGHAYDSTFQRFVRLQLVMSEQVLNRLLSGDYSQGGTMNEIMSLTETQAVLNTLLTMSVAFHSGSLPGCRRPAQGHIVERVEAMESVARQLRDPGWNLEGGYNFPGMPDKVIGSAETFNKGMNIHSDARTWVGHMSSTSAVNEDQKRLLLDLAGMNIPCPGYHEPVPIVAVHGPPGSGKSSVGMHVANLLLLPDKHVTRHPIIKSYGIEVLILVLAVTNLTTDDCLYKIAKENSLKAFNVDGSCYSPRIRVVRIGTNSKSLAPEIRRSTLEALVASDYSSLPECWHDVPEVAFHTSLKRLKRDQRHLKCQIRGEYADDAVSIGRLRRNQKLQEGFFIQWAHVIASTFGSLMHDMLRSLTRPIDFIIVEEGARASEAQVQQVCTFRINSSVLAPPRLVILLGDDEQGLVFTNALDPVSRARAAQSPFKRLRLGAGANGYMLRQQYRMNPALWALNNELFYGGMVQSSCPPEVYERAYVKDESGRFGPDLWLDSGIGMHGGPVANDRCLEEFSRESNGYVNVYEANIVAHFIRAFLKYNDKEARARVTKGEARPVLLVIAPYKCQVDLLKHSIHRLGLNPQIYHYELEYRTMDAAQGLESELTIMSLVRSRRPDDERGDLSFISQPSQVNVATSRQRCARIIVGNAPYLGNARARNTPWPSIVQHYKKKNCMQSAWDYKTMYR